MYPLSLEQGSLSQRSFLQVIHLFDEDRQKTSSSSKIGFSWKIEKRATQLNQRKRPEIVQTLEILRGKNDDRTRVAGGPSCSSTTKTIDCRYYFVAVMKNQTAEAEKKIKRRESQGK